MLSKALVKEIINTCLLTGGDFAEVYCDTQTQKYIAVENGVVESVTNSTIKGVGIRILKGLRSVYGHTNDIAKKSLLGLASDLAKSFEGEQELSVDDFCLIKHKRVNKVIESYANLEDSRVITLLKDANSIIKGYDERIVRVQTNFLTVIQDVVIFNSKGEIHKDHREHGRLILSSVAFENGKVETRFDGPGTQKGFSYFENELNYKELASENARKVIMMLGARECPSGKFSVVIGNGWGGVIFHEACGHQLEATSVSKGQSVFSGMYGQKIGSDIVSAYDDATIANEWGSNNIDDEGYPCERKLLIENGILKGYMVDPFNQRRMPEFRANGCSRRESYKYEPTSRMSNTFIAPGKSTVEEIIANTKLGIYAVSFGGGSVQPATGEFNFGCSEAYLIKDGKITEPLRGATLIGKATEILKNIDMVGNDLALGDGMCGSLSGSVYAAVGQPTIRLSEIAVGGRGGSIDEF